MAMWEERERRRAEILMRIHEAEVALTRGTLAEDVKRRGRARLEAENARRRRWRIPWRHRLRPHERSYPLGACAPGSKHRKV
jgi:hypothetical protein